MDETARTMLAREDQREPALAAVVRELHEGMSWSKAREHDPRHPHLPRGSDR